MTLLILSNNPDRASFRQRIGVYLDAFRESGIDCEIAMLRGGMSARRKLFRRASNFAGVLLHKKKLNPIDAFWLRRYAKKIMYNFDDAIMYSDRQPERNSRSHFRPWQRTVKIADMVITGNSYLAENARKFNSNVRILPIGLKVSDYQVSRPARTDNKMRLVWIGSKSTLNYLAQIRPALERVGARFDNVVLRIICDDFLDLENMDVEKCLWSEHTRAVDLAAGDIGLAPLPDNRFTRGKCSFKVLEYASAGLPVVASPVGTNADHVLDTQTGFLARDIDEWFDRITRVIENPQLAKSMGEAALANAKNFDAGIIGRKLADLIASFLQDTGASVT
jgi:glycosyltransferase involved in cell wall biosynthesis